MKPHQKLATHLGALAIGLALAAALRSGQSPSSGGATNQRSDASAESGLSNKQPARSVKSAESGRSAAFRSAWAALAKEPLTGADRIKAQKELLAKWADIDLDAALQAFLGEAWDNRDPENPWNTLPLKDAFFKVFAEHPMESWQALRRDKMAFHLLAGTWMNCTVVRDPGLVISMISEFPRSIQEEVVARTVGTGNRFSEEKRKELLN